MKFLQKEKSLPEPAHQHAAPRKKHKKDRAHTKEGEISAYFTAVRPALAEKDGNTQSREPREAETPTAAAGRHERERSTKSSGIVPTVELPDKDSYLGFGSRGPRHESTSYVSWSKSVQDPEVTAQHPEQLQALDREHHEVTEHRVGSTATLGEDHTFKRPSPRPLKPITHDSVERFAVSSVVRSDSRQRGSRSHSYPQHTSSPRKVNLVDRAAKLFSTESAHSPSSMPPSVPPRVTADPRHPEPTVPSRPMVPVLAERTRIRHAPAGKQGGVYEERSETEVELQTSSDLGNVIHQCNQTFNERSKAATSQRRHTVLHEVETEDDRRYEKPSPGINRSRHVRFSGLDRPPTITPNFTGPSIYERQAQLQAMPLERFYHEEDDLGSHLIEQANADDTGSVPYGEPHWTEPGESEPYDLHIRRQGGYGMEEYFASEEMMQHLPSENSVVASGFWRPNKLY